MTNTLCLRCCLFSSAYCCPLCQNPAGMRVFHSISLAMVLLFCQCNVIDADELTSGPVFTEQVLLPTDLSQPSKAFHSASCLHDTPTFPLLHAPPSYLKACSWCDFPSPCPTAQQDWHLHSNCCHQRQCMDMDPKPRVHFAWMHVSVRFSELGFISHVRVDIGAWELCQRWLVVSASTPLWVSETE